MASTVTLYGNGIGGTIEGNYGTYQAASDGTFVVDSRDAPTMLALGMNYVQRRAAQYTTPLAPSAATIGAIVASGALSDGSVAVTAQPTTPRPINVEVGTGTAAITAGSVAVTYIGNDGQTDTDTLSLVCAASSSVTQGLSRGAVTISSIEVSGVVGGASPWLRLSTTAELSLPVAPDAIDFTVSREYDAGATIAVGALGVSLGSITPTTAPNGTVTYSFLYSYTAPAS